MASTLVDSARETRRRKPAMGAVRWSCVAALLVAAVPKSENAPQERHERSPFLFSGVEATFGIGPLQIDFGHREGLRGLIPKFSFPKSGVKVPGISSRHSDDGHASDSRSSADVSRYFDTNFMFRNVTGGDLEEIQKFFGEANLRQVLGDDFHFSGHPTKASLMRGILEKALSSERVEADGKARHFLASLLGRVNDVGYGSLPPDVSDDNQETATVDVASVMEALDYDAMKTNSTATNALEGVYKFLATSFSPAAHVSSVSFMKARSRGEFLKAFFQELLRNKEVPEMTKHNIRVVLRYVLTNGKGEYPVDFTKHV
ncbi:uncharacterized protein LOC134539043 [Bacillus rossius redtenbacheri]|uniref:uncharacterized protein LOC134539043 n=1 Tax=Bacillus rossius redtenbacheri TaxID=93214 RepID=UPI002FDEE0C5